MVRSLDEIMVEQCAPTLAGIKPASLFRCRADGVRCPKEAVEPGAGAPGDRAAGAQDLPGDRRVHGVSLSSPVAAAAGK